MMPGACEMCGKSLQAIPRAETATSCRAPRRAPVARAAPTGTSSSHQEDQHGNRRQLLAAGSLLSTSLLLPHTVRAEEEEQPKKLIAVKYLSSFQRQDQKAEISRIVNTALGAGLTKEDAPSALRAVLHDAGTYDIKDGSGGLNGSIALDEELSRPENKSLKPYIDKLRPIKAQIDADITKAGQGTISWADLLVLAVKCTAVKSWNSIKIEKSGVGKGDFVAAAFGADFPVKIGRVDSNKPDPPGRLPAEGASVPDIQKFLSALNNKNPEGKGLFAPKAPFWERPGWLVYTAAQADPLAAEEAFAAASPQYAGIKKDYDRSRATVTRTDYEVDFVTHFTNLSSVGATFNPDMYLKPLAITPIRF